MAKPWSEVAESPAYQSLPPQEQDSARQQYFDEVVAPQVPEQYREPAWEQFHADTGAGRVNLSADTDTDVGAGSSSARALHADAAAPPEDLTRPVGVMLRPIKRVVAPAPASGAQSGKKPAAAPAPAAPAPAPRPATVAATESQDLTRPAGVLRRDIKSAPAPLPSDESVFDRVPAVPGGAHRSATHKWRRTCAWSVGTMPRQRR